MRSPPWGMDEGPYKMLHYSICLLPFHLPPCEDTVSLTCRVCGNKAPSQKQRETFTREQFSEQLLFCCMKAGRTSVLFVKARPFQHKPNLECLSIMGAQLWDHVFVLHKLLMLMAAQLSNLRFIYSKYPWNSWNIAICVCLWDAKFCYNSLDTKTRICN